MTLFDLAGDLPTCAHGSPWCANMCGPCRLCLAQLEQDCRAFDRDVFFGAFNWRGYTEAEWVASGHSKSTWREATT